MTREDIIRMAREAGILPEEEGSHHWTAHDSELQCFAQLVAQAERQKVVNWMRERSYATGHGDSVEDLLKELEWQIAEAEREACAKIAETAEPYQSADLIRARGQA